jgi:hypothetical protein
MFNRHILVTVVTSERSSPLRLPKKEGRKEGRKKARKEKIIVA